VNHQISPDAEHGRLQGHADDLGGSAETARHVSGPLLARHVAVVRLAPDRAHPAAHAHGLQHLGVSAVGLGEPHPLLGQRDGLLRRTARLELRQNGQCDEQQRAHEGGEAKPDVENEADCEVQRNPRQVEEGRRTHAGQEGAHLVEVAHRLEAVPRPRTPKGQAGHRVVDAIGERAVERRADPHQHPSADDVEDPLKGVERQGQHREPDEGRHAPARDDPIVDLQHVEGAGQVEDVDHRGDQPDAEERRAGEAKGGPCARCGRSCDTCHRQPPGNATPDRSRPGKGTLAAHGHAELRRRWPCQSEVHALSE
jgi:hypothetical protein